MIRAEELFRIDAVAELRALCEERLQGGWEVPAELVRFAFAKGARSVVVELAGRSLKLSAFGPSLMRSDLELLATAVAATGDGGERHRAIVELENRRLDPLLFVAALHGRSSSFQSLRPGVGLRLSLPAATLDELAPEPEPAIEIQVHGARYDRERATDWLREACRFAPGPVLVDGAELHRGFPDGLFRMRITSPLPAQVAVSARGHAPTLHLLRHGVVAARAKVPGYPAFHAAVEMSEMVPHGASAAQLRDAVRPHLGGLIDAAVELMIRIAPRFPTLGPEVQRRLSLLVLEAALRTLRARQLCGLPVLEGIDEDGHRRFLSIDELNAVARRNGDVLTVLDPDDDPGGYVLGSEFVPVLDAAQRAKLREITGIHLRAPTALGAQQLGWRPWRVVATELWQSARRRFPHVRRRVVDAAELSSDEDAFLRALMASGILLDTGGEPSWQLCEGRRRVHRGADGSLQLGRRHPLVKQVAAAVGDDPRALYPGLLALDLPPGLDLQTLRSAWWDGLRGETAAGAAGCSDSKTVLG